MASLLESISRAARVGGTLADAVAACAARATETKVLNAFVEWAPVAGAPSGVLRGAPIAVKANICVEGLLATAGSRALEGGC